MIILPIKSLLLTLGVSTLILNRKFSQGFSLSDSDIRPTLKRSLMYAKSSGSRYDDDGIKSRKDKNRIPLKMRQRKSSVQEKMKLAQSISKVTTKSKSAARAREKKNGKVFDEKSFSYSKKRGHALKIFDNSDLLDHEILTKEEEFDLGEKVQKLTKIQKLAEELHTKKEEDQIALEYNDDVDDDDEDSWMSEIYEDGDSSSSYEMQSTTDMSLITSSSLNKVMNQKEKEKDFFLQLSEEEIINNLQISGGRFELQTIINNGTKARQTLIKNNIRLVVSIAQKWCKNTLKNDGSSGIGDGNFVSLYNGGWSRPTLDEVIQEGVVGLTIAADRYDASRGFRFSTYATYWITNYVRKCFQTASTGCLRIPPLYHHIKQRYRGALKEYYSANEGSLEELSFPPIGDLATQIGVSVVVLKRVLRLTQPLVSIDQPITNINTSPGGKAGSDMNLENDLTILDSLPCNEPKPADQLERSMLRQCLENAMATELSPYERDVVRLRLGLDDGVTRTIREVAEVCGAIDVAEVRSAEARAFRKLRSPYALHTHQLFNYFEFAGIEPDIISSSDNNNGAATIAKSPRYQF